MLFSIIVPIYKVEEYIHRCMESLINQTFSDIEIVLVDDGSPDRCPAICDEYVQKDSRVVVVHKENGGLSDARNAGIQAAHGEYVMFVDSDDYVALDACENFAKYAKQKADVLAGDGVTIGGRCPLEHIEKVDTIFTGREFLKLSLQKRKMPRAAWLYVYKREFLLKNGLSFKRGILHEDEQFTPRAFLKAHSVVNTRIKFYYYIIRENSITTQQDKRKNAKDIISTCKELREIYIRIDDKKLKSELLDTLTVMYLNIFNVGKLYRYGKEYVHKKAVLKNAKKLKTKLKALLFSISPKLYCKVNEISKRM